MEADTRLKDVQFRTEVLKTSATLIGVIVAAMGAGAGLLAAFMSLAKWWSHNGGG